MAGSVKKSIRTRIAPSPTGLLHLGTARTALFNWLFTKNQGGCFILRIEDTDLERSDPEFEADIIDNLRWLGLDWDEGPDIGGDYGPYRQSERLDIYENSIKKLLDEKKAYYCFCSKEELEEERQAQLSQGLAPRYSGRCRRLTDEEVLEKRKNFSSVIRFLMPETDVVFKDLIRGQIKFNSGLFGDTVIAKDFRTPLYNFAVVVDDALMEISHVIRGEDHLSNTPKQILFQQALGFSQPFYVHLPLILDADRKKLSKRYSVDGIKEYRAEGYLADALVNFLAFLGWHPEKDREFLSRRELIEEFSLDRIQKGGAIFNQEKLDWLNVQHIKNSDFDRLAGELDYFIRPFGWNKDRPFLKKVFMAERERLKKLKDFPALANFFFKLPEYEAKILIWQNAPAAEIAGNLEKTAAVLKRIEPERWRKDELEKNLEPAIDKNKKGFFLWPLRAAVSGQTASPGPFEIMEVLGKEEILRRIEIALKKLSS